MRFFVIGLLISAALCSCGGRALNPEDIRGEGVGPWTPESNEDARSDASPPYPDLHDALAAEFDRLGIDPAKVPAKVASGDSNAVFDLAIAVDDPDGAGPGLPDGIELSWTERSIGDYDGNGIVNISDLTPLGQKLDTEVEYRAGESVGFYPLGDPVTDSANWLNARVDGDGNGLISQADITPIAQHWNERLSGYRVYRRGPDGTGSFELLPDPESPSSGYSIQRSAQPGQPVRYSYVDEPPLPGEYEYYVAAYDAPGSEESPEQSNMATINVEFGFADTMPPNWDTTVGAQSAVANPDGTVTLSWGSATEMAPLGVQTSEPVQYVVYYSTETPVDYERAARIDNISEQSWTSIPLVDGVEYYFTVRCRDSHEPPNEDGNLVELAATVTGGVVDDEWPVWSEEFPYAPGNKIQGIAKVTVEDGRLLIEHAKATDMLSPPVHYDLYYMDDSNPSEDLFPKPWPYAPNPLAQVVQDIPDKYELAWPNRSPVNIGVRARDSAAIPNMDDNNSVRIMTPGNVKITPFPKDFPGLIDVEDPDPESEILSDPFNHRYFLAYSIPEVEPELLRIVILDAETGEWELDEVIHSPEAGKAISEVKLAFGWDRNPWLYFAASGPDRYYKRSSTGEWTEWEPARDRFWDSQYLLDHNGNPAFYSLAMASDVQSSRQKLFFEWYDESAMGWKSEFVSDPGGRPNTILRPDGVLQLIVGTDSQGLGDETPTKGRLLERNSDGNWTEIHSGFGSMLFERFPHPTWEMDWGWAAFSSINGFDELLVADLSGYEFLPLAEFSQDRNASSFKQVKAGSQYHALPSFIFDGSEHHYQKLPSTDYNSMTNFNNHYFRNYNSMFSDGGSARDLLIDPQTGFYSRFDSYQNPETSQTEYGIFSFSEGETIFSE